MKPLSLYALLLIATAVEQAAACLPNEIHIREQWVGSYVKDDGTKVAAHERSEHCREINANNYFQNSTSKKFRNLKTKFKVWKDDEKNLLNKELGNLPLWLKKYKISEILRADVQEGNPENPAAAIPASKTLIVFDKFYNITNKRDVIIHEMSHIAVWDINPPLLRQFFMARGWEYQGDKLPSPPKKVLIPDSANSPSEDFANSVELYYSDPKRLKEYNPKSFLILESIIKSKEKP